MLVIADLLLKRRVRSRRGRGLEKLEMLSTGGSPLGVSKSESESEGASSRFIMMREELGMLTYSGGDAEVGR
jgi:hypothetical protein